MKKAYTLSLMALLLAVAMPNVGRADELTVANGTETNYYVPLYGYFVGAYLHTQIVYPADMVLDMGGGQITSLTWYLSTPSTTAIGINVVVSVAEVAEGSLASGSFCPATLTQVYTGTFDGTTSEMVIPFSTPFNYSGGHLLVDIYTTNTVDMMAAVDFYGISLTSASVYNISMYTPNTTSGAEGVDFLPKATFGYSGATGCQRPTSLTASNVDEETITVNWPEVEGAEQYVIYLDGEEYAQTNINIFTIAGLGAGRAYTIGVATNCGTEQSPQRTAIFRTACATDGLTAPWHEDFDDTAALSCWAIVDADGGGTTWQCTAGRAFATPSDGSDDADDWLISPVITFGPTDDSMMATWRVREHSFYGVYGRYDVYASLATDSADGVVDVATFTDLLASIQFDGTNSDQWLVQEANLSAYSGQSFRLAFRHRGHYDGLDIDGLRVQSYYVPLASIVAPDTVVLGQTGLYSVDLQRGDELTMQYTWTSARVDAGDATLEETPGGVAISYTAGVADTVSLTATNAYGTVSDMVVVPLKSPYVAPTVRIVGTPVAELDETAEFAAEIVFGSLDSMSYEWNSTMADASLATMTVSDSTISISYDTIGTDTLTVVATSAYGSDTARLVVVVRILSPVSTLPYTCDFEDEEENSKWLFATHKASTTTRTNGWYIDTAAAAVNSGTRSMYVSYSGGTEEYAGGELYSYWASPATLAYAYRAFVSPGAGEYSLTFDWKAYGESNADFMRVFVVPSTTVLTTTYTNIKANNNHNQSNDGLPSGYIAADGGAKLNLNYTEWQAGEYSFTLPDAGTYLLVFCWRNDGSVKHDPPAAVDNLVLTPLACLQPGGLTIDSTGTDYIAMHWTAGSGESQWAVSVGDTTAYVGTTSYTASGLNASSTYPISVRAICGEGDTSFAISTVAKTLCGDITEFPWTEGFENHTRSQTPYCWTATVHYTSSSYSYPIIYGSSTTAHSGESYLYNMTTYSSTDHTITATPILAAPANTLRGSVWVNAYSYYYDSEYQKVYEAVHVEIGIITDPDDAETFVPVYDTAIESYSLGWQLVNFSAEACGIDANAALAFRATQGINSSTGYFHIDDLTVYNDGIPYVPVIEPCEAPTNLHAANTTTSYIVVDWTPTGDETSWELERDGTVASVSSHPYIVGGLQPETEYTFRVRAVCTNGSEGLWSEPVPLSTLPEEPINPVDPECIMPSNLHASATTATSITLDWMPGGDETQWQLEHGGQSIDVNIRPYEVGNLEPETSYSFRIRSVCEDGLFSEWTAAVTVSTDADHNAVANIDATSFNLYPNPATNTVSVETNAGAIIQVIDQSGRTILSASTTGTHTDIDVAKLARGAYFVRVVDSESIAVRKLILK